MRRKPIALWVVVGVAATAVVGGVASASIPDSSGVIHGCYKNASGALRLIDSEAGESCRSGESAIDWNRQGLQGPQGPAGPAGPTTTELAPGVTQRGIFAAVARISVVADPGFHGSTAVISFPLRMAAPPTPHYLAEGTAATAECPGTATAPEAAPGHLCVYESSSPSTAFTNFFDPTTSSLGTSRLGTELVFQIDENTNVSQAYGSWAAAG